MTADLIEGSQASAGEASTGRRALALVLIMAPILAVAAFVASEKGHDYLFTWRELNADFYIFYNAGVVITGPRAGQIYSPQDFERRGFGRPSIIGSFFNPPAFAYLMSLLARLNYARAKDVFTALSAGAAGFVVFLGWLWGLRQPALWITAALAVISAAPLHMALSLGQPTMIYAALLGLVLLSLESRMPLAAGLVVGLMAIKPNLCTGPLLYFFDTRRWQALAAGCVTAATVFFVPFFFLGSKTLADYFSLTSQVTKDAFHFLDTKIAVGALGLANWNGYIGTLLFGDPPYFIVLPLAALSLSLMLRIWRNGSRREAWLAMTLTFLLITPHVLAYEWLLLFPAAFAAICERPTRILLVLLALVHIGASLTVYQGPFIGDDYEIGWINDLGGQWVVPAAFMTLVYLAFRKAIDSRLGAWGEAAPLLAAAPANSSDKSA